MGQGPADARGDRLRRLDLVGRQVEHAEDDRLAGQLLEHRAVEIRLRRLDRDLLNVAAGELGQEGIAFRPLVDQSRIAEADVQRGPALDPVERGPQRIEAVGAGLLGPRLHVGLVDLDEIGAGREQILDLGIDRDRIIMGHLGLVVVKIVLRLLGHGERARHGDLDLPVGILAQEFDVAGLDRVPPHDRADHPRHRIGLAAAVERHAGIVEVDAVQRGGEAVGIAFAAHLAVGDDVEPGPLLVADGDQGGVVHRLVEPFRRDPPQFLRPHPRREAAGELDAVDQPVGLGIGADEGRGQQHLASFYGHEPAAGSGPS